MKYADWAMGQFFQAAQHSDYWQDTLFLVVADHDNRVYGNNLVPVEKFRIPALILGGAVAPQHIQPLASQIDLAPTLLSLAGVSACHPFTGRDFSRDSQSPGRALLQFDQYFALLEQDKVVVLKPNQQAVKGRYDASNKRLELVSDAVTVDEKNRALAEVQLASYLYREQKYQDKLSCSKG